MRAGVDRRDVDGAARFNQDGVPLLAQSVNEWEGFGLMKGFASGDFYKTASIGTDALHHLIP
jgi:hypothetical protein